MKELTVIRALAPLFRQHPWLIGGTVLLGFLEALMEGIGISLFIPLFYSVQALERSPDLEDGGWLEQFMNQLFTGLPPSERVFAIGLCIFGLVLFKSGFSFGNGVFFSWLEARLYHGLRCSTLARVLSADVRFVDQRSPGVLLEAIEDGTWKMVEALSTVIGLVIMLLTISVLFGLMLLISWPLTLFVSAVLVLTSLLVRLLTRRVEALAREGMYMDEAISQHTYEMFRGMRTIHAFGRAPFELGRFAQTAHRIMRHYFKLDTVASLVHPVTEVLTAALILSMLLLTLQEASNLPLILTFLLVLHRLSPHVRGLDSSRVSLLSALPSIERVREIMAQAGTSALPSGTVRFTGLRRGIRLDAVTFRYNPEDAPALRDVSLLLPQGKTTALVGPSGAGKTTLANLVLRFYDPTGGVVSADDVPLPELDLASWRDRIAIVSQEVYLFDDSLRANIAYGRLEATLDEIVAAARRARIHDFISTLPGGYETRVGDQGIRLSAGQRQRIALARALVRDPDVVLLDEATSALDSLTEALVQTSLRELLHGRTVLVIAHRLVTVRQADHIVVLNQGRIEEQGTLEELLERGGLFARMCALQQVDPTLAPTADGGTGSPVLDATTDVR